MEIGLEVRGEGLDDGRSLVFSQQSVVDENTRDLTADGFAQQGGHHCRIDATGEAANHPIGADFLAEMVDRLGGKILQPPSPPAAAERAHKVGQNRAAGGGVRDLGMKLQAVHRQRLVADCGQRAGGGAGKRDEVGRNLVDLIAVAHPHLGRLRHSGEQACRGEYVATRPAVFARRRLPDAAAQGIAGQLHAVADAQHRDAQPEDLRVAAGSALLVHAGGTSREDDAARSHLQNSGGRDVVPDDLAVDVLFAHPPRDELGVLGAEIEHEHPFR